MCYHSWYSHVPAIRRLSQNYLSRADELTSHALIALYQAIYMNHVCSRSNYPLFNGVWNPFHAWALPTYASNGPITPKRKKLTYTDAKDRPSNNTEDPRGVKPDTDPAVTVPAENDTSTIFSSSGMKKIFKKTLETRWFTMESRFF